MSSLNEFIAQIKKGGLQKPSKYEVILNRPPIMLDAKYQNNEDWRMMLLFCEQATLPGVTYTTTQSRSFGEFREMPYERIFDPLQLSFYCDSKMWIKSFFDGWINSIQDGKTRVFNYYDRYTANITVNTLDNAGEKTYGINLFECYPKSVSAVQLDYNSKDVMRLQVTMQYRYWRNVEYSKSAEAQAVSQVTTGNPFQPPQIIVPQDRRPPSPNPGTNPFVTTNLSDITAA